MDIQSVFFNSANYIYDALNRVYENTPLKKTSEVSGRFFNSLLKKPKDFVKGIEVFGRCYSLILKEGELAEKVAAVVKGAGKCKGWLTLLALPDQIGQVLNLRSSNVISFKNGDRLRMDNGHLDLREGDSLHLTRPASIIPNAEFQLQNGALFRPEDQVANGHGNLPESRTELHLSNGNVYLLSNEARFQFGNLHTRVIEANESTSLRNIFTKPGFRKSLNAWTGVYVGAFESAKFLNIARIASPVFFQISCMFAILLGAVARLGDDHQKYQAQGVGLENFLSIAGNVSVFALGAILLASKKGMFRDSASKILFFCSAISVLTNLSGHFLKSMHAPRYQDIDALLQA